jgi:hypothetical protein
MPGNDETTTLLRNTIPWTQRMDRLRDYRDGDVAEDLFLR